MFTLTVALLAIGSASSESFKGCFSTRFVDKYVDYYRLHKSIPLEHGFSACNNRLTKYIGLQVDKSIAITSNFVYCGNDLLEVSQKVSDSSCQPCKENASLSCGDDGFMSVYLLRDSTPLSFLMITDQGLERLIDNETTLQGSISGSNLNRQLNYIYSEDTVISTTGFYIMRSTYDPLTREYTSESVINSHFSLSLAVDYIQNAIYFADVLTRDFYKLSLNKKQLSSSYGQYNLPDDLSIDPYSRILLFLNHTFPGVYKFHLDEHTISRHSLEQFHVERITRLTVDPQDKLIYALVIIKGDRTMVSIDYEFSKMTVLFSGPLLDYVSYIEVFNGEAVWLRYDNVETTIYKCKLTPKCSLENLTTVYKDDMKKIHEISLYHPEKQTPGKKWLCARKSCVHGCELFSPFTARCT